MRNKKAISVIIAVLLALSISLACLNFLSRINVAHASLTESTSDVNAYSNSDATTVLQSITWEAVSAGGSTSVTFYLKNTGSKAYIVTPLDLTDFVFEDDNHNTLSGDYAQYFNVTLNEYDAIILSGQIMKVILTLTVSSSLSSTVTYYNFNVNLNFNQLVSPADLNQDGVVTPNDFLIFVSSYVNYYANGVYNPMIDYEHTGVPNADDLFIFVGAYIAYFSSIQGS
jgi:archaellum component FlaG (FlaF/FlaG flagellin family)